MSPAKGRGFKSLRARYKRLPFLTSQSHGQVHQLEFGSFSDIPVTLCSTFFTLLFFWYSLKSSLALGRSPPPLALSNTKGGERISVLLSY